MPLPYTEANMGTLIRYKPNLDMYLMIVNFYLPSTESQRKVHNPLGFLSNVLNYRGENSLYMYLREQVLARELHVSISLESSYQIRVNMDLTLTKKGLDNY